MKGNIPTALNLQILQNNLQSNTRSEQHKRRSDIVSHKRAGRQYNSEPQPKLNPVPETMTVSKQKRAFIKERKAKAEAEQEE